MMSARVLFFGLVCALALALLGGLAVEVIRTDAPERIYVAEDSSSLLPKGFESSSAQAVQLAEKTGSFQRVRQETSDLSRLITYEPDARTWTIQLRDRVQTRAWAVLSGRSGKVLAELEERPLGEPDVGGQRQHSTAEIEIRALMLALILIIPFIGGRSRRLRPLVLDLLALAFLAVAHIFWALGDPWAVPLQWLALAYLLWRLVLVVRRGDQLEREPIFDRYSEKLVSVLTPVVALALIGLNVIRSTVIDVGYGTLIGASHIASGADIYSAQFSGIVPNGDTYGPIAYLAYLPFELVFGPLPLDRWGVMPAAHAASIFFYLATALVLFATGMKLKGRPLAWALAFTFVASPMANWALQANTNDTLVTFLLALSLYLISSPAARGALIGLAAAAKFGPLGLLPLIARGQDRALGWRRGLPALLAGVVFFAGAIILFLPDGGLGEFYARTFGLLEATGQAGPGYGPAFVDLLVGLLALAAAAGLAFWPKGPRSLPKLAAMMGIILSLLTALQFSAGGHWPFYYLVWLLPAALVAFIGSRSTEGMSDQTPASV